MMMDVLHRRSYDWLHTQTVLELACIPETDQTTELAQTALEHWILEGQAVVLVMQSARQAEYDRMAKHGCEGKRP